MGAARKTVERWVELYNNGAIDELITRGMVSTRFS